MTTNPNLDQAREWAKDTYTANLFADTWQLELAEVINALPETIVDGEELRSQIERVRRAADDFTEDSYARGMLKALEAFECLLPAPDPRKTLADMTSEERAACQWMQADYDGARVVLTTVTDAVVSYLWPNGTPGTRSSYYRDMFTPLPDLPRMVWPDEHPATEEDVSIIPPKNDTSVGHDDDVEMKPENVPAGELWLVEFHGKRDVAERELSGAENPWWLMRGWRASDKEVTLVSRLVPEVTA